MILNMPLALLDNKMKAKKIHISTRQEANSFLEQLLLKLLCPEFFKGVSCFIDRGHPLVSTQNVP